MEKTKPKDWTELTGCELRELCDILIREELAVVRDCKRKDLEMIERMFPFKGVRSHIEPRITLADLLEVVSSYPIIPES